MKKNCKLKPLSKKAKMKMVYAGGGITPDPQYTWSTQNSNIMAPVIAQPSPTMSAAQTAQPAVTPVATPTATTTNKNLAGSKGIVNKGTGAPTAQGVSNYAGYAAMALNAVPDNANQQNLVPTDPTIDSAKGLAQSIPLVGQFVQLGSAASSQFDAAASKEDSGFVRTGLNYQSGMVDPASGWSKNKALHDKGAINDAQYAQNVALHLISPGLDTISMDKQNRKYLKRQREKEKQEYKPQIPVELAGNTMYAKKGGMVYKHGGVMPMPTIINAERNELIVDPVTNRTIKDLKNLPPHPENEAMINPDGNIKVTPEIAGKLVIPKNGKDGREAWLNAKNSNNAAAVNRIKRNLINKQEIANAEANANNLEIYKDGGKIKVQAVSKGVQRPNYKLAGGGRIPRYDTNTLIPDPRLASQYTNNINPYDAKVYDTMFTPDYVKNYTMSDNQLVNRPISTPSQDELYPEPRTIAAKPSVNRTGLTPGQNVATGLLNNAGNLYQLGNAVFNREKTTYVENPFQRQALDLLANRRYDIDPQLESNKQTFAAGRYATRNSGAMGQGQYLNNLTSQLTRKYMGDAQAWSLKNNMDNEYRGQEANARLQSGEANRAEKVRVNTANEQNRAKRQDMITSSLGSIGRNLTQQSYDNSRIQMLDLLFQNAKNDPALQKALDQMILFGVGGRNNGKQV